MSKQTKAELAAELEATKAEKAALETENRRLLRSNADLRTKRERLDTVQNELALVQQELQVFEHFTSRQGPPGWLSKAPKSSTKHHATPWLMLSDLHLDEVVNPDEVMGVNAYSREIARLRLDKTAQSFVEIATRYWTDIKYDGAVVCLGGDIFSGDIHEELKETNEDTILGSLDYWIDPLADAIGLVADSFGKVHVPVVVGNHGRTSRKPRAKLRVRSNFDWFLAVQLARAFENDDRVTFQIPESADCLIPSYDDHIMMTHGDQATGGQGIGGIWPPLMRLDARKRQRQEAVDLGYDILIMGHWHQLVYGPSFIVNGSLKGYDEYAFTSNFGFEPPAQACWLMTPEHGKTWTAPVYSMDRAKEGW